MRLCLLLLLALGLAACADSPDVTPSTGSAPSGPDPVEALSLDPPPSSPEADSIRSGGAFQPGGVLQPGTSVPPSGTLQPPASRPPP